MQSSKESRHILVVDDEEPVRALLKDCFELDGFRVSEAANGRSLLDKLAKDPPHLITLDLKLGGEDGFELARRIRASCNVPIVMITGKGDTIDRVVGLELGADDYIAKPFHIREVLARVRAVLRRYELVPAGEPSVPRVDEERYQFDRWTLDIPRRELKDGTGAVQELTTSEFDLLALLVRRPSRVLSRDNIMDLLKGHEWSPLDRSIDSLIVRVRRKVEANPEKPSLIKTVRGVGYVFAGDVRRL